ncbi:MAG: exo-beta-N-acetylmuramidase NamZ family protein [Flavobacteriaceae bacterium]
MIPFRLFKSTFLLGFFTLVLGFKTLQAQVLPGAQNTAAYLPLLHGKRIAVVAHAASQIYGENSATHLIDSLVAHNIKVEKIFAPEHGFRSRKDNGANFDDEIDSLTQIPIISLHGKNRKPSPEHFKDIDLVVFDLQDVGVRFYTYLSTLHLVMEACAENKTPMLLFDRPNPNGHYVDGPVMEDEFKGFVGMHNVPIVHGMTLGEYAQMINAEKWLNNGIKCDVTIIKNENYTHSSVYNLPVRPSPNLPNAQAVNLYPSLCLLEQTPVSVGRGTEMQFQIFGHPEFKEEFSFTPHPNFGAQNPKLNGVKCYGLDLRNHPKINRIELKWLIMAYRNFPDKKRFFGSSFVKIAGTNRLENQIKNEMEESQIRASWEPELSAFKRKRKRYLLYPSE